MYFAFTIDPLPTRLGFCVRATDGGHPLTYAAAIELWQREPAWVDRFVQELRDCPFDAFFFEAPPVTRATLDRPFEFVLLDAPPLARVRADSRSFRAQLDARRQVVTFRNLGGDAVLIAPCDHGANCAHLASFSRTASTEQVHELWRAAAVALDQECGDSPRWLSTSGLGVAWLHLRIDERPKYYSHGPYRRA